MGPARCLLQHVLPPEEAREAEHKAAAATDCLGSSLPRAVVLEAAVVAAPVAVPVAPAPEWIGFKGFLPVELHKG